MVYREFGHTFRPLSFPTWFRPFSFLYYLIMHILLIYGYDYFDLSKWKTQESKWPKIVAGINKLCADRYRDRKNKLKRKYKDKGLEEKPEYISKEDWKKLHDL